MTAGPAASLLWATVLVENAVYGLLLGLRMRASRRGRAPVSTSPPVSPAPSGPVAQHHVAGRNASLVLVVISVTAAVYYGSLLLWLYRPSILGSSVLASSWPMYAVGVVVSTCGLSLMGWSYAVFRSWRWRAEVEPGHLLMTEGPFARTRHPIYLSFALFYVGAFFLMPYLVFALHAVASFVAYDYRAGIEERVMIDAFGDDYRRYRDRTHRYIPGVY